jgi:hypothetical protein
LQAGDRLLHQPEPVLHQGRPDVLDPDLVIGLHAGVVIGLVGVGDLVAAALLGLAAGIERIRDRRIDIGLCDDVRHPAHTNGAGDGQGLLPDRDHMFGDP